MIILHFDRQPQFKYMNYFIYTSHHFTPQGRYELNKLTSLPMDLPLTAQCKPVNTHGALKDAIIAAMRVLLKNS